MDLNTFEVRSRSPRRVALAAGVIALSAAWALAPACAPAPPSEGYVTTDDSVRLFYRISGRGAETVVAPMDVYLAQALAPLAGRFRLITYDPRNRGRSGAAPLSAVSLDRQILDLEQLRAGLKLEKMALLGWSGLGMEMAVYAIRYPHRVSRLIQVAAVPPSKAQMDEAGGDRRDDKTDKKAVEDLDLRYKAGEADSQPAEFCRLYNKVTIPSNFADPSLVRLVPDVCEHENEWPKSLWPYFGALLGSFGDYDWRPQLGTLDVPRLVIHGREDGIPVAGAYAWSKGFPNARLVVLSPAGHFPFLEQPEAFFAAVERFLDGEWPEAAHLVS
jgi:proline iminopeptidase